MLTSIVHPVFAQVPKPKSTIARPTIAPNNKAANSNGLVSPLWQYSTLGLALVISVLGITSALQHRRLVKKLRFETLKNQEMHRRIELAAGTITKMEKNPDLIHSRDVNLDYVRMRMSEERFRFEIVNQIKIKIKQQVTIALRPTQVQDGELGVASTGRQIDQIFDVEQHPDGHSKGTKRVLFRVEIKIVKLPTQATSQTINQITDCLETFLSPGQENDSWQPTIQGRLANIHWDQTAKPTPRVLLEQTQEGANVTFRTNRITKG